MTGNVDAIDPILPPALAIGLLYLGLVRVLHSSLGLGLDRV